MKRHRPKYAGLFTLVLLGAYGPMAHSYTSAAYCGGHVTWHQNVTLHRDRCSAPDNSPAAVAISASRDNWNAIHTGLASRFGLSAYNGTCGFHHSDSFNQYGLVARSSISGYSGLTVMTYSSCYFSAAEYLEGDIMMANDMAFTNEDESFWGWSSGGQGQVAVAHEYGHYIGLGHTEAFDIMRASMPLPLIGGTGFHGSPISDDAAGARWLYPNSAAITDVYVSAQKLVGGNLQATDSSAQLNACRNGTISVTYTLGNRGTTNVNGTGFRIYLTQSPGVPSGGINLFNGTANTPANSVFTETRTLTIPGTTPNGGFWIQWQIDTNGTTSEAVETNNFVRSAMTVNINC